MTTEEILLKANESLTKVNEQQSRQIAELTAELKKMAAQIAWFQQQMFGRKSEKHLPADNQPSLFDAAGVEIPGEHPAEPEEEPEEETVTYTRKKIKKECRSRARHGRTCRCWRPASSSRRAST